MNFTPELNAFQGVLIAADNVHKFSLLTYREGNEEKFSYITGKLLKFLQNQGCITSEKMIPKGLSKLRKFAFYLALNTDFSTLEELDELPVIDMLIWTVPTIPKPLFCEIYQRLFMDTVILEIIAFCCPSYSIQILDCYVQSLKYLAATSCHFKIKDTLNAAFILMGRFHFYDFTDEEMLFNLTKIQQHIFKCISYLKDPPNSVGLAILSEDEQYKIFGNKVETLLSFLISIFEQYASPLPFTPEEPHGLNLYICTFASDQIKTRTMDHQLCDSPHPIILEYLQKFITTLLDVCMNMIMDINVDVFCTWSDFQALSNINKTIQQIVGEQCYLLQMKLKSVQAFSNHDIMTVIPQLAKKPPNIQDIIAVADRATILENVALNDEHKLLWLRGLLEKDEFYDCQDSIECFTNNLDTLDADICYELLNAIRGHLETNETDNEALKLLAVKAFAKCDHENQEEFILGHFAANRFNDFLSTSQTDIMLTEVFNKLTATPDLDLSDVLNIFIQNPRKTYMKVLGCCVESAKQCAIMHRVVAYLDAYSSYFYSKDIEATLIQCIKVFAEKSVKTEQEEANYVTFVAELKDKNYLTTGQLLMLVLMPNLHTGLAERDSRVMHTQLRLLARALEPAELRQYRAPLLGMLAQIMECLRWNISTFTADAAVALDLTLDLQIKLMSMYSDSIPEKDKKWLKSRTRNLMPLNMYYYRKLWDPPGDNYIEIVSGRKNMNARATTVFLVKLLSRAAPREWRAAWDGLRALGPRGALHALYAAFAQTLLAERQHRGARSWPCVLFCYRNLVLITKEKYLDDPSVEAPAEAVVRETVAVVNSLTAAELADAQGSALPLLALAARRGGALAPLLDDIRHKDFAELARQVLLQ